MTTSNTTEPRPFDRSTVDVAPAPRPRLVHIGLGAFHRAHQLWYTQHSEDDAAHPQWGYASFSGRSADLAHALESQDGLYTLVERGPDSDEYEVISALVEARPAENVSRLWELLAARSTAVLTITVTEAAYNLGEGLAFDPAQSPVAADLEALTAAFVDGAFDLAAVGVPATMAGKVVVGLAERRRQDAGGLAVVSCDNLSANDVAAHNAVQGLAAAVDPSLGAWVEDNVSFVATSIDRITPRSEDSVLEDVARETGYADRVPVVTEPFRSWVLQGEFPAGRPDWEKAGAEFVDDIEPFERRKLWLLNGSHSLMAYAGQLRGHATVADAIGDPVCRAWVNEFWDEASQHLTTPGLDVPGYREALLDRFSNPRIAHHLAQIAMDGSTKLQMRAVPVLKAERAAGRPGTAAARSMAAWITYLDGRAEVSDARSKLVLEANTKPANERIRALIAVLDAELAQQEDVVDQVEELISSLK
ncbi:mannitol dehydrogenase family protein [Kocuria sp. cx-116]|uniref:mannitol dehydrogenase family protein n=1 Tax=Kocuria sp. cx-116 TaxID=2771378 RepID=UPI00168573ED|nr:mannitol dehydrogenase family protein [Kocuria sp. cx-116]MBD2763037.1 mannitol dehydrogenase family protein [Kocuria sp. cx-116]